MAGYLAEYQRHGREEAYRLPNEGSMGYPTTSWPDWWDGLAHVDDPGRARAGRSCETMPSVSKFVERAAKLRTNVTVTVNGKPWRLVSDLADSSPRDPDFTVSQTADGKTVVTFGDNVHGALPPAGSEIAVRYKSGGGAGGNTVTVNMERKTSDPGPDQALWIAIRNRTHAICFEFSERPPRTASRENLH